MPDPTTPNRPPLSSAAQAVLDSVITDSQTGPERFHARAHAVAALRAAADQVVPEDELFLKPSKFEADLALEGARNKLLAIAAELEGHQ